MKYCYKFKRVIKYRCNVRISHQCSKNARQTIFDKRVPCNDEIAVVTSSSMTIYLAINRSPCKNLLVFVGISIKPNSSNETILKEFPLVLHRIDQLLPGVHYDMIPEFIEDLKKYENSKNGLNDLSDSENIKNIRPSRLNSLSVLIPNIIEKRSNIVRLNAHIHAGFVIEHNSVREISPESVAQFLKSQGITHAVILVPTKNWSDAEHINKLVSNFCSCIYLQYIQPGDFETGQIFYSDPLWSGIKIHNKVLSDLPKTDFSNSTTNSTIKLQKTSYLSYWIPTLNKYKIPSGSLIMAHTSADIGWNNASLFEDTIKQHPEYRFIFGHSSVSVFNRCVPSALHLHQISKADQKRSVEKLREAYKGCLRCALAYSNVICESSRYNRLKSTLFKIHSRYNKPVAMGTDYPYREGGLIQIPNNDTLTNINTKAVDFLFNNKISIIEKSKKKLIISFSDLVLRKKYEK